MAKPAILGDMDPFATPPTRELPPNPLASPHDVQAAVEGVPTGDRLTFMGRSYKVAPTIGAMPYFRFAAMARHGVNMEDMEGVAAVFDMLRDCFVVAPPCDECETCRGTEKIEPDPDRCPHQDLGDWPRFEMDASRKKATPEDLMAVIQDAVQLIAARPTRRPADSSAGPSTTSPNSMGSSLPLDSLTGLGDLVSVDELMRRAEAG